MELLENRRMLSAVSWVGNGDGHSWASAANWSTGVIPGATDDVTVNAPPGTSIQGPGISTTIKSLDIRSANLTLSGPAFTVMGAINVSSGQSLAVSAGTLSAMTISVDNASLGLSGGTLINTTITKSGASQVSLGGSTLEGITLNGDYSITSGVAIIHNGMTLNGTLTLGDSSTPSVYGALAFQGSQVIGGAGAIVFGSDNTRNALTQQTDGASITIGSGITVRGKTGYLGYDPLHVSSPTAVVINDGTIEWTAGTNIVVPTTLTNNGTLSIDSTGHMVLQGTVIGGRITGVAGATLLNVTLDSTTLEGDFLVANGVATVHNGITLNGTMTLGDPSTPNLYGALAFQGNATIDGTGTIVFGNDNTRNALTQQTDGASITIGSGITVRGKTGYLGYDPLHVSSPTAVVVNHGTIEWTAGTNIVVPKTLINHGTLSVSTAGVMDLQGTVVGGRITGVNGARLRTFTVDGATLEGVFTVANSSYLTAFNGLTLNGTVTLGDAATPGQMGSIDFIGTQALSGAGTIVFGNNNIANTLRQGTVDATLTIGAGITVRGETGFIGYNPNRSGTTAVNIVNLGTISADVAGGTITVFGGAGGLNSGSVRAFNGGSVTISGSNWKSTGVLFAASNSSLSLGASFANAGSTMAMSGPGTVILSGNVTGGVIAVEIGTSLVVAGGTWDGVTVNGDFRLVGNSYVTALNGLVLNGTATLGDAAVPGQWGSIDFNGTQTLGGSGAVVFGNSNVANTLRQGIVNATLTLGAGITIRGKTGYIGYNPNRSGETAVNVINLGTMLWSAGTDIRFGTSLTNRGIIRVDDTGVLNVGGTLIGGVITAQTGARFHGGTLDGVTVNGDFRVIDSSYVTVLGGLTLNGTVTLGDPTAPGQWGSLDFIGTQTLGGAGTVIFGNSNLANTLRQGTSDATLTIGAGINIRGQTGYIGYNPNRSGSPNVNVVNLGVIEGIAGTSINIPGGVTNRGSIRNTTGTVLSISNFSQTDGQSYLSTAPGSTIAIDGDLIGSTQASAAFVNSGEVRILGGTSGTPRLLEAMSLDRGVQGSSTISNFYYSVLRLGTSANVQLVDQHRNSAGNLPDVIYAGTLIVPAGATLDLNGLILYARQAKIDGTIIGGTIHSIPDSGPLTVGSTTPGAIQTPGELDEWTFYSRAGRTITIQVNPSASGSNAAIAPVLDRAQMTLIDPAGNTVATATNASTGGIFELNDVVLATEGTYRLRVRAAAGFDGNTGNYNLVAYDSTAEISNTTLGKVANGTIENAFSIDRWDFNAAQNQQLRLNVKALTSPDLAFTLTGPNGFTAFTDLSVNSDLVTLPSTGTYHLTVRGRNGATGKYSYVLEETSVTDVNLGQVVTATNAGTNAAQLFRIHVPTAEAMVIRLDDSVDTNRNLVLVKYGAPPTLGVYDYSSFNPVASLLGISSSASTEADHSLLVPSATVGDWYVLVVGGHVPSPSTFTIQAATSNVVLTQTMPVKFSANSNVDLTLTGAGFKAGAIVQLVGGSNNVVATASQVEIDSFTQISATVSLTGVAPGTYGIRVTLPDGNGDFLPQSFTVLPAGQAKLETRLIMPGFLGHHVNATIYVEFANTGTAPMAAPLLRLQSADGGFDQPILTLDQNLAASGLWINESAATLPDGFSESVQILASGATPGVLNPGERISVPVYFVGLHRPQTLFEVNLHLELRSFDATSQDAIPWSSLRDGLRPPTIPDDAWSVIYGNVIANVGSTWGDFVEMLSDNAKYLNRLGRRVVDVGELWSFELQQAIGFGPVRTLATSIDAAVTATGTDLSFGRLWSAALDQRFETSALGRGWSTPWQVHLTVGANGSVDIFGAGGSHRRFEKDARLSTGFIAPPGETGTLVIVSPDVYEIREQNGFITRFKSNGQLDFTQDANGNRVTAGYDGSARLISLTHSNGASIAIAYNAAGLIQSLLDSENRLTTFTYDASNQYLLSAAGPDGVVTSYTYDTTANSPKQHALTSVTTGGVTRAFLYDNRGRLAAVLTRLSPTTETARIDFNYDSAGRVSVSDAGGGTVNLFYDDRGLLTKVTDQFGNVTTAEYGNDLRISRIVDPLGQSQAFTWCGCGSLTSKTDQLGNKTSFNYEYVGPANSIRRMTSFTDANGNTTRYTYDNKGNLTSTIYPNGSIERTTAYDPMGDPLTYINRRGQAMSYAYNAAGQVTRQTFDDGSFIDLAYDARRNLSTVTEPGNNVTTYTYDSGDRLTKVLYPQGRFLEFTYDAAGRRSSMTDQLGYVVNYAYDAAGRLYRLTDSANALIVEYLYDSAGRLSRKNNGNDTFTDYTYDVAGQILSIYNRAPDGSINSSFVYTYDVLGRRTSMTTVDGTWLYGYDPTGQLTSAAFAPVVGSPIPTQDLQYVYDALGNRIRTIENGVTTEYATNNLNQYTHVGADALIYDADGNLISRSGASGIETYSYDQQSRMNRVVTPDGTWEYEYDSFGNRTASTLNGERTEYLLDPTGLVTVIGEYSEVGAILARLTFGHSLVSRIEGPGNGRSFFDNDAVGSTVGTTDSVGAIISRHAYTPFGALMRTTGYEEGDNLFVGAAGTTAESRGVYFMRSRYYDSTIGRFMTIDPIRLSGGDVNLSRYVANQPTLLIDPTGLAAFWNPGPTDGKGAGCGSGYWSQLLVPDETFWADHSRACEEHDKCYERCGGRSACDANLAGDLLLDNGWLRAGNAAVFWAGVRIGAGGAYDKNCKPDPDGPIPPSPPGGDPRDHAIYQRGRAIDPNELFGPSGYGLPNFVGRDATLPYRIEFENYGPGTVEHDGTPAPSSRWATAPAQRVEITNQLPALLDLETFSLTGFGFGEVYVTIPAGTQLYQRIVSMTFNGKTFEVWIEAALDHASRSLRVVLQSIDPETDLPPDALTGFLPPEDGTGRGRGFVTYTARTVAGVTTGTEIRNVALISFDHQFPISTDQIDPLDPALGIDTSRQARVTIDAGTPTAVMQALAASSTTSAIALNWSGIDDAGGSGVGRYDVFVSDNGGAFTAFLTNTTQTSATFNGIDGHTYQFYAVATDNVGNVETGVQSAEATTRLEVAVRLTGTTLEIYGTAGVDTITFTGGANLGVMVNGLAYSYAAAPVTAVNIYGNDGNDTILINGVVSGAALKVYGGNGNDTLRVGSGVTVGVTLDGGDGGDLLVGGVGNDVLIGGLGNDWLNGGAGFNSLTAGVGNDVYAFNDATANQLDTIWEYAGEGTDLLNFTALTTAVTVNLNNDLIATMPFRIVKTGVNGQAANIENVNGGRGNDVITGNASNNVIYGNGGNDTLNGGDLNDQLDGGAGNDLLIGGNGDDILSGGAGDNYLQGNAGNDVLDAGDGVATLAGGQGDDTYVIFAASFNQTFTLVELAGEGVDTLNFAAYTTPVVVDLTSDSAMGIMDRRIIQVSAGQSANFENVTGGSANDRLTGNAASNILKGGAGNDTLTAGDGNDILIGGAGDDTLRGISGRNILIGGGGADLILGGTDDDLMISGSYINEGDTRVMGALLAEWARPTTYTSRQDRLTGKTLGGVNGGFFVKPATIVNDSEADYLIGGTGIDWFFSSSVQDVITDIAANETSTAIN